ncbi:hydroxymethylpyrimidine/phosphomethylpyrimidine kinase [Clostridia bacterium]|nr:hydroxymethylpyrimidine/phosphomethylpyrimidine kinase [Clostridia bacterium]
MVKVLTIAGSDSSGGAGIQADIKTITAHKAYAMSVITALTAQNTTGVFGIHEVPPEFVEKQIDAVFADIYPDAVKIGMVSNPRIIKVIAKRLKYHDAKNIVVDPVMVSTSGSKLLSDDSIETLTGELFPLASVVTPNIPEAELLCGFSINNESDMKKAGRAISERTKTAVLVKGGHLVNDAVDFMCSHDSITKFGAKRIDNTNTHGTGCTLSSAIACGLAFGYSLEESVKRAKDYVSGALSAKLDLGAGSGPLDHTFIFS